MAVNCEAVKQIQHEHDEHQLIQPPDNTEVQHPPVRRRKTREGTNDRRQMCRIGGDDGGDADIK